MHVKGRWGRALTLAIAAMKPVFSGRRLLARFATTIVATLIAGCATNPITGRSQLLIVSEEQAIGSSATAYRSMMSDLEKKQQIEVGTPRAAKVKQIVDRLVVEAVRLRPDAAQWKWEVKVIDDPKTVNAFAMAGGKTAIYSGMWDKLKATDDEIAQVMGHEIGHAIASHTRERMSVALATGVATSAAAIAVAGGDSRHSEHVLSGVEAAALVAITLPNSREAETEADAIGIDLAARAGYDPRAAVTLWEKMAKLGGSTPEFLSTHPAPERRKERLQELGAKLEPVYRAARAARQPG